MKTRVFIPTSQGDVNIEKVNDRKTLLETTTLSQSEKEAVVALLEHFKVKHDERCLEESSFSIPASIERVHAKLVKLLKKDKSILTAVKLSDGTLSEVREPQKALPPGDSVSVPAPSRGCPPREEPARRDLRATRVLHRFLNPAQLEDFLRYGAVCVVGGDTGHRYSVCHPHAKALKSAPHFGHLVVDLEKHVSYCSYAMAVPAAEEMLAHILMIAFREREWTSLPA